MTSAPQTPDKHYAVGVSIPIVWTTVSADVTLPRWRGAALAAICT